jgi:DNA-binding HxlR family transcriptional regulator
MTPETRATKKRPAAPCDGKGDCPITKVAELLSDTWTMLIMRALTEGPKRFSELERWLDGISSRTLALKLRTLQKEGMLTKSPAGVYSVTKKGKGIRIIEAAMIRYSRQYL